MTSNLQDPTAVSDPAARPHRRGGFFVATALASALLFAGVVPALAGSAEAAPRACPISRPACNVVTQPTRPIVVDDSPPPTWMVRLVSLAQASLDGTVSADRSWINSITTQQQAARSSAGERGRIDVSSLFGATPAGSATLFSGGFFFPVIPLPTNSQMILRVKESGNNGSLCRTTAISPLPASGVSLRLLVAPPISKSAADLNEVVASFAGPQTGLGTGVEANITSATLSPGNSGLGLRLMGTLKIAQTPPAAALNFRFDDRLTLTLDPVNSSDTSQAISTKVTQSGSVLSFDGTSPAGGANILAFVKPVFEAKVLASVRSQAGPAVNNAVGQSHDVRWWTEQGFTLSVRKVAYSTSDLKVYAALCKLG